MLPNWLVAFVLSLVAAWQIKRVLRYRANNALFIREVIGDSWIDKSRLRDAIRYYILREALFFISLPTFAVFSYVGVLVPYLLPIAISILAFYGLGFLWWEREFSARKLKS